MVSKATLTEFEKTRLVRTERIVSICSVAWGAFGLYYLTGFRWIVGTHCLLEGLLGILIALRIRVRPDQRERLINLYVAFIILGLTFDACFTGLERSLTPAFLCCAILVSTLTLGPRRARVWLWVTITMIWLIHFVFPEVLPHQPAHTVLDRALANVTLLCVVTFCSFVAEFTTEAYAGKLEATTNKLRDRTVELKRINGIDSLTALRNRRSFIHDTASLSQALPGQQTYALLSIDLNDFKTVNDRLGHAVGDQVLQEVSRRLMRTIGQQADVYRLGGDEFLAIVQYAEPNSEDEIVSANLDEIAQALADSIVSSLENEINASGSQLRLGVSVGIASSPRDATTIDDLLSCADKAMYAAKTAHASVAWFEPRMAFEAERQRQLREDLAQAIKNQEFTLHYQPQIEIETNRIIGVEALIRWERAGEIISPLTFIPCLEETGKIVEVGLWVIRQACEQADRWNASGYDVRVSANVSPIQFQDANFAVRVLDILNELNLPPNQLDLEITESLFLARDEQTVDSIKTLTDQGVSFSIDDFGTGYSCLAYLKQLPVSRLKIDRSFVKDIPHADDGVIAATIISLAHYLDMTVVAEGVENETQLDFLRQRGCDEYQGYFFSRPLNAEDCTRLLLRETPLLTIE